MYVNLLPSSFVLRRIVHKRLRQWAIVFGLVATTAIGLSVPLLKEWWGARQYLQFLEIQAEPVRDLYTENIDLLKQSTGLEQKLNQLTKIASTDHSTKLLGIVTQAVKVTKQQVQIQELNFTTDDGQYLLAVRGIGTSSEAITQFMEGLQTSNVFPRVELRSTQERLVSEKTVQEFQLECRTHE